MKVSSDETEGTLPAGEFSHLENPGTFSSIFPLTAGVLGPQQGGFSSFTRGASGSA
jgi:hypothetical protein